MSDYSRMQSILQRMSTEDGPFQVVNETVGDMEYPVYKNAPESLRDLISRGRQYGDRDFIVYGDERLSFDQMLGKAMALAHWLVDDFGIQKGERVGIAMRNYPEWMIAFAAIVSSGAVVVPINAWWGGKELDYAIEDSGIKLVFADEQRLHNMGGALSAGRLQAVAVRMAAPLPAQTVAFDAVCKSAATSWPNVPIAADDLVCIMYTSGSTGHPKGVATTNRAAVHALWYWHSLGTAATELTEQEGVDDRSSILLCLPLFHVAACHGSFLLSLLLGRTVVVMYKWDALEAIRLIEKERITHFNGVPTMSMDLLSAPERARHDLNALMEITFSGAATPPERLRLLAQEMPAVVPKTGYGMTETSALGAMIFGDEYQARPGSVGVPNAPVVEIRLMDETGQDVAPGEEGEVCMRSVANMVGYWNKPEATAQTLRAGWLRSGDLGRFDDEGYLYIVGRLKEIIIRGGENISCNEVEAAVYEHPGVLEACVYGVPDDRLGEAVAVSIVPREGHSLETEALMAFLKPRLAGFKIPAYMDFRNEPLPRVATGKTSRRQLQEDFREKESKAV